MTSSSGSTSFSSWATLGGRSCTRGCTYPIGASSLCWVTGPGCCASATVHVAELARIAAAKVAARTPERDAPISLRLERSRQSRFIENSYSLSPPHSRYVCCRYSGLSYLPIWLDLAQISRTALPGRPRVRAAGGAMREPQDSNLRISTERGTATLDFCEVLSASSWPEPTWERHHTR